MNSRPFTFSAILTIFIAALLVSCEDNSALSIDYSTVPDPFSIEGAPRVETETGLIYYVVEEGDSGITIGPRDQADIFYTKRLKSDKEKIISSSYANGVTFPVTTSPYNTRIVAEEGFKQGLLGMTQGERRVLILPPELAYGNNPNSRYTNDTLWIDVELDKIIIY